MSFAVLLTAVGCSKKAPVAASHPPDTTPVASTPAPPPSQPMQQRATPPQQAQSQPVTRPMAQMTPQERATLNEKLAKLADALFDYDKATIRDDATTALKDDVG